jgi:hypothetical protein
MVRWATSIEALLAILILSTQAHLHIIVKIETHIRINMVETIPEILET